jgi:ABC-type transport system substrate-binding protein
MTIFGKKAITRVQAAIVIVVIVVAVVGAALYTSMQPQVSQTSSTAAQSSQSMSVNTLTIDAAFWPLDDLNQLYAVQELPWPSPLAFTVYQPLVTVNMTAEFQTGGVQFLPGLATWTVSPDGTTYTFTLKPNVKFSNGDPLNAYQVWAEMYGFYYLSGNSSAWLESYALMDMSNVNFGPATINLMTQSGLINPTQPLLNIMMNTAWPMYVTSSDTIVFHLIAPFAWFPGTLVVYDGLIYDTQWLLQNGGFGTPTTINSYFNQHPIPGTGPYVVTAVSENSFIKFAQNPTYWGANLTPSEIAQQPLFDPGHAQTVIMNYKTDDVARYTDLSTGAAQIADIETPDWNLITQSPQTYSYFKPPPWSGEVALLGLNTHEYPTNITLVRQAIVHALNYTDIADKAYGGQLAPYVGPEYPWWKDYYNLGNFQPYQYNLTLAKQLLAEANIQTMPTFLLRVQSGCPLCINAAQVMQSDLAQIGINVNIAVIQPSLYNTQLGSYQTNVANAAQLGQLEYVNSGFGWGPATVTPTDYWVTFVSNQSVWGNYAAYYNPVVQKAVNAFFTNSSNPAYLQSLVKDAQAQIYQDAPYAWLGTFGLWLPWGGSIVWKTGTISGFLVDPVWTGQATEPIFNTVTFGPNA